MNTTVNFELTVQARFDLSIQKAFLSVPETDLTEMTSW